MRASPPGFSALLAQLPLAQPARRALHRRLAARGRHYHGAAHVALLWRRHRRLGAGSCLVRAPWDRMIACAIAFHDAVHDARRGDNEAASGLLWRRCSGQLGAKQRRWVEATILATADHLGAGALRGTRGPARFARAWLLDLDLTPLGERPGEFAANTRRLRCEFGHLPAAAWDAGRLAFLGRMAAAPRLFKTRRVAARFGGRAQANLARTLKELTLKDLAGGGASRKAAQDGDALRRRDDARGT
jgi:predicted metal-dependent HD superfamily phosphohydrolase